MSCIKWIIPYIIYIMWRPQSENENIIQTVNDSYDNLIFHTTTIYYSRDDVILFENLPLTVCEHNFYNFAYVHCTMYLHTTISTVMTTYCGTPFTRKYLSIVVFLPRRKSQILFYIPTIVYYTLRLTYYAAHLR